MNKFVFIHEMKTDQTRTGKMYTYILDQDRERWNFFNGEKVELHKGYIFRFEQAGEYRNVKEIEPVVNIWKQEALKEIASRNDIIRNFSISLGHALEYSTLEGRKPPLTEVFETAGQIYDFINAKTDSVMAEINKPIDKGI